MLVRKPYGRALTVLILLAALFLVIPGLPGLPTRTVSVLAQSGDGVRVFHVPAAQVARGQRLAAPPARSAAEIARLQAAGDRTHIRANPTATDTAPARPRTATALAPTIPQPLPAPSNPGDFAVSQNSTIYPLPAGTISVVAEPSVGNYGQYVFETGNWFAAVSTNGGDTFTVFDPETTFTSPPGQRFCCDQHTLYVPSRNMFVWVLLYTDTISGGGPGTLRVAVANGPSGLASLTFHYFDFTPQTLNTSFPPAANFPAGDWFDYPYLALSNNYLYISANVYKSDGVTFDGTTVLRLPLDALAATSAFTGNAYVIGDKNPGGALLFNATLTQGATNTMYWATHYTNAALRVYAWPEGSATVSAANVSHTAYPNVGTYQCPGPDNRDWCGWEDDRVVTAWVSNGILGFMWNASQGSVPGGFGAFRYPYLQTALLNQASFALLGEPLMYNNSYSFGYAGAGVNARGHIAGTVFYGGGALYPTLAAFIWDNLSPQPFPTVPSSWETYTVAASESGPFKNRYGDFLTARQNYASSYTQNTWVGTGYVLIGGSGDSNARPMFLEFGRKRDNPLGIYPAAITAIHKLSDATDPATTLRIVNQTTSPSVSWNASAPAGVTLSATSGSAAPSSSISITISAAGKGVGVHSLGTILISGTDALGNPVTGAPQKVPVNLLVGNDLTFFPLFSR